MIQDVLNHPLVIYFSDDKTKDLEYAFLKKQSLDTLFKIAMENRNHIADEFNLNQFLELYYEHDKLYQNEQILALIAVLGQSDYDFMCMHEISYTFYFDRNELHLSATPSQKGMK